jgi:hypothetical protein
VTQKHTWTGLLLAGAVVAGCGGPGDQNATSAAAVPDFSRAITRERLQNAASEPHNWLTHGGTYLEQRHSPLTHISKETLRLPPPPVPAPSVTKAPSARHADPSAPARSRSATQRGTHFFSLKPFSSPRSGST